ncbi:DUF3592 domain-containing protein [Roseomonas sp. WA12]
MNPVAILFWGFMLGVPALALGSLLRARHRQRGWVLAEARPVDPGNPARTHSRTLFVTFTGPAGPITAELSGPRPVNRNAPRIGETLRIAYNPTAPSQVAMDAAGPWHLGLLVVWSAIFALLVAAFLWWLSNR